MNLVLSLTEKTISELEESLLFFHREELRALLHGFGLSEKGKKLELVGRIIHFLKTGEEKILSSIPAISRAKKGENYPLHVETLMLKGAYKNDLAARLFFKRLIGESFHFTAFGIDWLEARWLEGCPPTYGEFALYWKEEDAKRKNNKVPPKQEWAYINFTQNYLLKNAKAEKVEIIHAWEQKRKEIIKRVTEILKKVREH